MPRPLRPLADADDSTPVQSPRGPREATEERSPGRPLGSWLGLLAAGTLLFGACSGLASGCEAAMHTAAVAADGASKKTVVKHSRSAGRTRTEVSMPAEASTLATVGVLFRALYALACAAAVFLAGAALSKTARFNARALLAYAAAGLAALRLVLVGIDHAVVESAMELARAAARQSAGYSYNKAGVALNQIETVGTTAVVAAGAALVIFWIVTAVSFWEAPGRPQS